MTNTEGLLWIALFIELFLFLIGLGTLAFTYIILKRTKNSLFRIVIILTVLSLNFILFRNLESLELIFVALCFVVPITVLAPIYIMPVSFKKDLKFNHIIFCYLFLAYLNIVLPFILVSTGISTAPFIFWSTSFSNAVIYICLIFGLTVVAIAIYKLISFLEALP